MYRERFLCWLANCLIWQNLVEVHYLTMKNFPSRKLKFAVENNWSSCISQIRVKISFLKKKYFFETFKFLAVGNWWQICCRMSIYWLNFLQTFLSTKMYLLQKEKSVNLGENVSACKRVTFLKNNFSSSWKLSCCWTTDVLLVPSIFIKYGGKMFLSKGTFFNRMFANWVYV